MARRRGIAGARACCVLVLCLACSACATSRGGGAGSPNVQGASAQATCLDGLRATGTVAVPLGTSHPSSGCQAVPKLCRWLIAFSQFQTHTDPGTFVDKPPGSCPSRELDAILRLAVHIRMAGTRGTGLCSLVFDRQRSQAERVTATGDVSCGVRVAVGGVSSRQISQPVSDIILFSSRPGPPHWSAYLGFADPVYRTLAPHQSPPPGTPAPVNAAIAPRSDGSWALVQIPYEP